MSTVAARGEYEPSPLRTRVASSGVQLPSARRTRCGCAYTSMVLVPSGLTATCVVSVVADVTSSADFKKVSEQDLKTVYHWAKRVQAETVGWFQKNMPQALPKR